MHAATAELWWGHFKECKQFLKYAYSFYSETPMHLPNQYSKEINMLYGTACHIS